MFRKLNIGILGCANIARKFIIPTLKEMMEFNIIGIASRSQEKADEFSEEFNLKAFYSYECLLAEKNLDAVYIPLPNSLHYSWIKKALENNIHVLVEKTMACELKEVEELNKMAEDRGLVLIENFQFRFHSQLQYIKNLVDNGSIGELRNMRVSFGFPPFADQNNIRYKKELGGGALLDAGAYPLKISQIFMDETIYVDSSFLYIDKDREIDIYGSMQLKDKKTKIVSQCSFGFDNFYQCSLELWGSKGRLYTNRIFTAPPGYSPILELETSLGKEILELSPDNHFKNMLSYFHNKIINKDNSYNEYKCNIKQSKLIHEVRIKNDNR